MDAEKAHHLSFKLSKIFLNIPVLKSFFIQILSGGNFRNEKEVFGIKFKNPVGLAAGFDKDGKNIAELASLGFGFIEVGTVAPKPQDGNPKPRMFRLPEDEAIINRMGFNNEGVDALVERLKHVKNRESIVIGGNIGKNKITPNEEATGDYIYCFEALFNYVDYFVVNVSSPNTPGLRELQEKGPLLELLKTLQDRNQSKKKQKPILLKIAPDLTNEQLDDIIEVITESGIAGLIATNTTISREGLKSGNKKESGGLSGKPLTNRSNEVIKYIKQKSDNAFPVIGVGGIMTANDAKARLEAGADLIQVYSGFVYHGPKLIKDINRDL